MQSNQSPLKLHLGCGRNVKDGYLNVDQYVSAPNIIYMDIFNLTLENDIVDEIFTEHMLEHLSKYEVPIALKEWSRVLKSDGRLVMNLPNLEWCLQQWLDKPEEERWGWQLDTIFGLQTHPGEFHKTGFTKHQLHHLLTIAGFSKISINDYWSHGQSCFLVEASKNHILEKPEKEIKIFSASDKDNVNNIVAQNQFSSLDELPLSNYQNSAVLNAQKLELTQTELQRVKLQIEQVESDNTSGKASNRLTLQSQISKTIEYPSIKPVVEANYQPSWSVMIPTYNGAKYLKKTLLSVLKQDIGSSMMQIEVIDDCSTEDDIEAIVNEIGQGRISFHRQSKNLGLIGNWNACIQRARGHLVHILHQDDLVMPGFYASLQVVLGKEPNVGAAFCRHSYIDENDNWMFLSLLERKTPGILSNWLELIATMQRVQFPSIVVRRSTYEQLGGFCPQARSAADWEMWKRIATDYQIWYEPQILACFRLHSDSESSHLQKTGKNISDVRRAIDISQSYLPKSIRGELSDRAREYYALDAFGRANQMLVNQDLSAAICLIKEGLKCSDSPQVMASFVSLLAIPEADPLLKLVSSILLSTEHQDIANCNSDSITVYSTTESNLEYINLIIFPDWEQEEELLYKDLSIVIKTILCSSENSRIVLWIDHSNMPDEDANLIISDILLSLLQEEDLDITENLKISLVKNLNEQQWSEISAQITAKIVLNSENKKAINKLELENIVNLDLEEFKDKLSKIQYLSKY